MRLFINTTVAKKAVVSLIGNDDKIIAQEAKVEEAQASVKNYQAQIVKTRTLGPR